MEHRIHIYNTLTRQKEQFVPLHSPFVGLYVCGPTVYGDPHLGHARAAITFDVLFRLLKAEGYRVRYVRNITDVGHLEHDDEGEDKIAKRARLESLEPMEISQHYTLRYHDALRELNTLPPSIEPRASGHILEQIAYIEQLLERGYAYEVNGSVYFDIAKYSEEHTYGELSGRRVEEMLTNTRELAGQSEKRNSLDFALWKNATPEHIMRWPSPWGEGYPGWHLECSAMGEKYLGSPFDIHGGGLDLLFPHHECELAQSVASQGHATVRYWVHNNLVTINGQKMGKSLGNFITLEELFAGKHDLLSQPFSPMAIRFFILQAHYRSTLDFSDEALQAASRGYSRLSAAYKTLLQLQPAGQSTLEVQPIVDSTMQALYDDMNTSVALSHLFEAVKLINQLQAKEATLNAQELSKLRALFEKVGRDILGLELQEEQKESGDALEAAMEVAIAYRQAAKEQKNYALADTIRDRLNAAGIEIHDRPEGATWQLKG